MKKIIFFTLLPIIGATSFSQQTNPSQFYTLEDYLKKSKSQKTGGFIFLGIGVTTLAIISKSNTSFDVLPVFAVGGTISTLVSIPLFIATGKNKRKWMSISLKNETAP